MTRKDVENIRKLKLYLRKLIKEKNYTIQLDNRIELFLKNIK